MKTQEIKFRNLNKNYSIVIGNNILKILQSRVKKLCPQTKKIALIFDEKVPKKYKSVVFEPTFDSNSSRCKDLALFLGNDKITQTIF